LRPAAEFSEDLDDPINGRASRALRIVPGVGKLFEAADLLFGLL
jgi:hypothetical protein